MTREPDGAGPDRPLDQLAPGECGVIARLESDPAVARRLMELGLVPGTPIELSVRGIHLSLRRSEASRIHVASC